MSACPSCREWRWEGHRCPPPWRVWNLDNGETEDDGGVTVYALTPAGAVEKWAEDDDRHSADYNIVGGETPLVGVRSLAIPGAQAAYFWARGETVPQYHTTAATLSALKRELVSLTKQHRFREAGRLYCRMHEMELQP